MKDLQWLSALEQPAPIAFLNFWQQNRRNSWSQDSRTHIRVSGDAAAMLPQIRRAIAAVDPRDPYALLAGPAVLAAMALLAIWLPARRAMAQNPVIALRMD